MFNKPVRELDKFFNPRSVAVIGASADKTKLGYILIENLQQGARRKIYPINPKATRIAGLLTYASVLDIKADIDLVIIAVPSFVVPQVLEECGQKQIKQVIVISAGFKEVGEAGLALENQIKSIAKQYKIKLVGPNCLGLLDAESKLNASFVGAMPLPGSIAFLSQSGAVCSSILDWSLKENIGFSKFVSLGNEAGLTENDFLEYLAADPDTKAILMYLEAVSDGARFINLLKKITPHKPVVILKAGRSARGGQAVSSHTGSLTSDEIIIKNACLQAGAIYVTDLRTLFNITKLFNAGIYRSLSRLCILTNGGGPSIILSDLIEFSPHLTLVELSQAVKASLRQVLPPSSAVGNPIDLIGDAPASRYESALKILTRVPDIDAIIAILTPQKMTEAEKTAKILIKYSKKKPILPMFIGETTTSSAEQLLKKHKLGNFEFPSDLQEILEAMSTTLKQPVFKALKLKESKSHQLDLGSAFDLMKSYRLDVSGVIIRQPAQLKSAYQALTGPLAMKVISSDVVHKTDWGAVQLNLTSLTDLETAWRQITNNIHAKNPQARLDAMLVQPMTSGLEVIIGMKRDQVFGPVLMFGLGGIMVEVFKDISVRVAPIDEAEALKMIHEIKSLPILKGIRGTEAVNIKALVKILVKLSKLALEHPEIKEIDLNPVMVNARGATIVDVRMIV